MVARELDWEEPSLGVSCLFGFQVNPKSTTQTVCDAVNLRGLISDSAHAMPDGLWDRHPLRQARLVRDAVASGRRLRAYRQVEADPQDPTTSGNGHRGCALYRARGGLTDSRHSALRSDVVRSREAYFELSVKVHPKLARLPGYSRLLQQNRNPRRIGCKFVMDH